MKIEIIVLVYNLLVISELTGTPDGLKLLCSKPKILTAVARLIRDEEVYTAKDAMRTLVNISAEETGAEVLLSLKDVDIVGEMVKVMGECSCGLMYIISYWFLQIVNRVAFLSFFLILTLA